MEYNKPPFNITRLFYKVISKIMYVFLIGNYMRKNNAALCEKCMMLPKNKIKKKSFSISQEALFSKVL